MLIANKLLCLTVWMLAGAQQPTLEPFLKAIKAGDAKTVRALLDRGADPNAREVETTRTSLEDGPGGKTISGDTALNLAIDADSLDIVKLLVARGADVNGKGVMGFTPLISASQRNLKIVDFLLSKGAKPNQQNDYGDTAIIFAANNGETEIVATLLKHGAQINGGKGWTPLMQAAYNGHVDTVKYILKHGADPNFHRPPYMSPLECAQAQGYDEIAAVIRKSGGKGKSADAQRKERDAESEAYRKQRDKEDKANAVAWAKEREFVPDDREVIQLGVMKVIGEDMLFSSAPSKAILLSKSAAVNNFTDSQMTHDVSAERANQITVEMRQSLQHRNPVEVSLDSLKLANDSILVRDPSAVAMGIFEWHEKDARCWVQTALPGYSPQHDKAVLRGWIGPSPHGESFTIFLTKAGGTWRIEWCKIAHYV